MINACTIQTFSIGVNKRVLSNVYQTFEIDQPCKGIILWNMCLKFIKPTLQDKCTLLYPTQRFEYFDHKNEKETGNTFRNFGQLFLFMIE